MAAPTAYNRGDPNVYTTYRGSYNFTLADGVTCPSTRVLLTAMNQVQFCANADVSSVTPPGVILTLPETVRPKESVYLTCPCRMADTTIGIMVVRIAPNGELSLLGTPVRATSASVETLFLDSLQYDLASDVYGA